MTEVSAIDFLAVPSKGTVYRQGLREYHSVDWEPYTRKDGTPSKLIVWETCCKTCGQPFQVKSGLKTKALAVNCPKHRITRR